jgi:hypothetical protein
MFSFLRADHRSRFTDYFHLNTDCFISTPSPIRLYYSLANDISTSEQLEILVDLVKGDDLNGIPRLPASERRSCVESLHETSSEQPGPARTRRGCAIASPVWRSPHQTFSTSGESGIKPVMSWGESNSSIARGWLLFLIAAGHGFHPAEAPGGQSRGGDL